MTTTAHSCSCGTSTPHVIARRMTADGIGVALHHDGAVTGRFGSGLEGVPVARPRTREARELALRVGWLFAGEVSLYDYSELGLLYAACRWAAAHDGLPGTVRSRMAKPARLTPVWTVVSADRDGRPTCRYWRLPRLISPGTVVWDHVSVGASGGRYEIHRIVRGSNDQTCNPSGIRFHTLDEVSSFILSEKS